MDLDSGIATASAPMPGSSQRPTLRQSRDHPDGRRLSGKGSDRKGNSKSKNMFSRGLAHGLENFLFDIRTLLESRAASQHLTLNFLCELCGHGEKNCFIPLAIEATPPAT
jgi:hypothetical protein